MSFYQITTDTKVSKFFVGKHFIRMTEQRVRAKYVYVFENDCVFVITAMGALFLLLNGISQREIRFERGWGEKNTEWRKREICISKLSPAYIDFP